ncbi:hypothetical protein SGQ44_11925 [Flavobacterium sp. Fl-77]|uniref:Lipocalin-like domain-containing protein n=1 Tax=Flavobacterium flavipigmentatum TaxID=2893884 RepID=A0AAJ2SHT5_9FLAO|nr:MULTISPECIES: hypothetical protein [unclassified Flavobacterium]MDX6183021.1 hypothetical protein [Flavobacterium sp. Fl-33]MDX6186474.1 hypothetical protein [Flavobacterium sp. Fl-77]UFH37742.1 hypothetical protein LNP22_13475 [Flavobacterium sp. F-70]
MKKIGIIFILVLSLFSCSNETKEISAASASDFHGKWTLIKMSGTFPDSETTGNQMEWQEFYIFNTDRTFVKTRVRNNTTTTESGIFETKDFNGLTHFELTFLGNSTLAGNCYGNSKESLFIDADGLLTGTWRTCDGPGLVYKKSQ